MKLLLKHPRVDPTTDDNYAIRWASLQGHWEVVKLLLEDSRVNSSAIQEASLHGHWEVVKLLEHSR